MHAFSIHNTLHTLFFIRSCKFRPRLADLSLYVLNLVLKLFFLDKENTQ